MRKKRTILSYFIFLDRSLSSRSFRTLCLRRNHLHAQPFQVKARLYCKILLPYGNIIFSILFVLFCVQSLCCKDSEYHSLN